LEADFIVATNDAPAFERGGLALVFDADLIGIAHYIAAFRVRVGIVFGFAHAIDAFFVGIAHRITACRARIAARDIGNHVVVAPAPRQN